jgi:MFS-type transporter involved in bile tolerance (Atg22 family)
VFAKIQKWLQTSKSIPVHRSAIYIIAINLFIMGLLPIYGLLGAIQAMPFGLKTASEVFIFGGIYGLQIGAVQTYSRSVFSSMVCSLIHATMIVCAFLNRYFSSQHVTSKVITDTSQVPKGFECTFFGAYEVTDKGSSWVAPLIAAFIMSSTKTTCGVHKNGNVFQLDSVSNPFTSAKPNLLNHNC